jgi:hypothetical protein
MNDGMNDVMNDGMNDLCFRESLTFAYGFIDVIPR